MLPQTCSSTQSFKDTKMDFQDPLLLSKLSSLLTKCTNMPTQTILRLCLSSRAKITVPRPVSQALKSNTTISILRKYMGFDPTKRGNTQETRQVLPHLTPYPRPKVISGTRPGVSSPYPFPRLRELSRQVLLYPTPYPSPWQLSEHQEQNR